MVRTGNFVRGYVSTNGVQWQQVLVNYVNLGECAQVGLYVYNKLPFQTTTASFSNLSVTSAAPLVEAPSTIDIVRHNEQIEAFPNPTNGELTLNLNSLLDQEVTLEIMSNTGQVMQTYDLGELATPQVDLNLFELPIGVYFVRVQGDEAAPVTKRVVIQR